MAGYLDHNPPGYVRLIVLVVVIELLALVAQQGESWSDDIAELSPISSKLRDQDRALGNQMGAPEARYLLLLVAPTSEDLLQQLEARTVPGSGRSDGVSRGLSVSCANSPQPHDPATTPGRSAR